MSSPEEFSYETATTIMLDFKHDPPFQRVWSYGVAAIDGIRNHWVAVLRGPYTHPDEYISPTGWIVLLSSVEAGTEIHKAYVPAGDPKVCYEYPSGGVLAADFHELGSHLIELVYKPRPNNTVSALVDDNPVSPVLYRPPALLAGTSFAPVGQFYPPQAVTYSQAGPAVT